MKKCFNCGYESQDGNFCPGCGGSLVDVEQNQQEQAEQVTVEQPVVAEQPVMQQPPVQQYYPPVSSEEVSVGSWVVTILLSAIPCVNLIMFFVWAFGGGAPVSKSNWAKAQLIFVLISAVISLIASIVIAATGASIINSLYYY